MTVPKSRFVIHDDYVTDKEAAAALKVTRQQIHVWATAGLFPRHKIGHTTRFRWSEIQRAIKPVVGATNK